MVVVNSDSLRYEMLPTIYPRFFYYWSSSSPSQLSMCAVHVNANPMRIIYNLRMIIPYTFTYIAIAKEQMQPILKLLPIFYYIFYPIKSEVARENE